MDARKRNLILAGIGGAVGGALGSACGSNSWIVVAVVSAVFAILTVWGLDGMVN
ncbi:MAG: hypothetical protein ABIF18_00445 [archaeon]